MNQSLYLADGSNGKSLHYLVIDGNSKKVSRIEGSAWVICCVQDEMLIKPATGGELRISAGSYGFVSGSAFQMHALGAGAKVVLFAVPKLSGQSRNGLMPISDQLMVCLVEILFDTAPDQVSNKNELITWVRYLMSNPGSIKQSAIDFKKCQSIFKWYKSMGEGLSEKYPRKRFGNDSRIKSVFGVGRSVLQYGEKMKQAWKLLCDSRMSIEDVSRKLGYSDVHNFISAFKKYFGVTPGSVQKVNFGFYI